MIEIIPNWHPVFVHFTIALLATSSVLFVTGTLLPKKEWSTALLKTAHLNLWIGTAITILTLFAGWSAYTTVVHDGPSHIAMTDHRNWAIATSVLWGLLAIWSAYSLLPTFQVSIGFIAVLLVASILLTTTAYKGAETVYRYGIGVISLPQTDKVFQNNALAPGQTEDQPANPHADHDMGAMPQPDQSPGPEPQADHEMPMPESAQPEDSMVGHDMGAMPLPDPSAEPETQADHEMPMPVSAQPEDSMVGHDMGAVGEPEPSPPEGPPPPEALSGPTHAADTIFDPEVMANVREKVRTEHGDIRTFWIMADRFELNHRAGTEDYLWDIQGWYGGDINKLWVKTEGEGNLEESPDQVEVQALWSRAIMPWFDFQAGVRYDYLPGPNRTHLVAGLQGLMPYQFEIDAAAFLSNDGDFSARLEGEYDQMITQRLILQPRIQIDLALQDSPELGIGAGLNSMGAGLRLRYEFAREFAPYIGVEYESLFGDTASYARSAGKEDAGWNFLIGIRTWF